MSDDLRKLIEAVEAEDLKMSSVNHSPLVRWGSLVMASFDGSLDAAIALCEALLPGWDWWVNSRHYWDKSEGPLALIKTGQPGIDLKVVDAKGSTSARALLLAVLRAKLMEASHE